MKAEEVESLFSRKADSQLCDDVFVAVAKAAGIEFDTSMLPQQCRIISLVWYSAGIVGANGFESLLEGDFVGDPGYKLTFEAYREIGALEAFRAFQDTFDLFPSSVPPVNRFERMQIYQSIPGELRFDIDLRFFQLGDEISSKLAAYIRVNEEMVRDFLLTTT